MKSIIALVTIGLFLCFQGCKNPDRHKEKISTLDSLRIDLDKKAAVFASIDTLKLLKYIKVYESNIEWIKTNINDTLSIQYIQTFKKYQNIHEPLIFIQSIYPSLIKDVEYSKVQLQKLSEDLKKDLVEDEKAFEFYTIEKMEAEKLSQTLQQNYELAKQSLDTFDKYNLEIEKLINERKIESK